MSRTCLLLAAAAHLACTKPASPPVLASTSDAGARAVDPLVAVAERLRATCAAEFSRVAAERRVPGAERPDCALPEKARLIGTLAQARTSLAELPQAMQPACALLLDEVEAEVRRAAASSTPRPEAETVRLLAHFERVVLVGVVADALVPPRLNFGKDGRPSSFVRGGLKGVGYLYAVRDGAIGCASRASAVSSRDLDSFRAQGVDEAAAATLDLDWDVMRGFLDGLERAPRLALVPAAP
jgi:hypothetical protein